MSSRAILERFFVLTDSADVSALADCLGSELQGQFGWQALELWAEAGPAADLVIEFLDRVDGRDRFRVTASLADGGRVNWRARDTRYFIVGADGGSLRIVGIATALAAP